mmetsp:Transcript_91227/g.235545  ORF Transcript_91227/g.235545 Transcript_91227/m.235545 type:complete len:252 (+) Transcript_91227:230-985(+)
MRAHLLFLLRPFAADLLRLRDELDLGVLREAGPAVLEAVQEAAVGGGHAEDVRCTPLAGLAAAGQARELGGLRLQLLPEAALLVLQLVLERPGLAGVRQRIGGRHNRLHVVHVPPKLQAQHVVLVAQVAHALALLVQLPEEVDDLLRLFLDDGLLLHSLGAHLLVLCLQLLHHSLRLLDLDAPLLHLGLLLAQGLEHAEVALLLGLEHSRLSQLLLKVRDALAVRLGACPQGADLVLGYGQLGVDVRTVDL